MGGPTRPNGSTPSHLTIQVIDHVRGMIESGELHPGDRLPPERELSRKLKISRSSLRAGIGFLSAMGVLKSRHGAGTFIAEGPPALDASSLTVLGALHGFQPWQMFEARLMIERSVAGLAAARATDEHIAALAEEVADMYASLDDPREYLIHDVRFHRTIALASGNPILATLMETITAALYDRRSETVEFAVDLKQSAEMHRDIYRAIRMRSPEQAQQAMEQHLNQARKAQETEGTLTDPPLPHAPRTRRPSGALKSDAPRSSTSARGDVARRASQPAATRSKRSRADALSETGSPILR